MKLLTKTTCLIAASVLCTPLTQAEELSAAFKQRALDAIKHPKLEKRKAAYRTFQHLGPDALPGYTKILKQAQRHYQSILRKAMSAKSNPYIAHSRALEELESERERVLALIHTDYKKDPGKIRMLQKEMEGVSRKYKHLHKLAATNTSSMDKNIGHTLLVLSEIQWELLSMERKHDGENASDLPDQRDLDDAVNDDIYEAEEYRDHVYKRDTTRKSATRLEDAEKHNADCKWANGSQKSFSDHLNKQRALLGLQPLLLEERLSAASFGHSQDMRSAGFFSHTSPIPGKRSPADRARKAKFKGSWTGENIFMGSPSPMAAYGGWFGSDGHRFIMFTRGGSNVIGVGVAGGHWTMMTGRQ